MDRQLTLEIRAERLHRAEEDVDTFVGVHLSEEPEAVPRRIGFNRRRCDRREAVVLEQDPLRRDSPLDVAPEEEPARADEVVDQRELGLDEPLAHVERLGRDLRETLVAPAR